MRTNVTRQRVKTLASILAVSAFSLNIWAQQRNVRLEVKDMQVEQALLKLRKESGYKFLFNHEEVKHAGKKTVSFPGNPLTEVLDALLAGTNLTYRIEKDVVVIMPKQTQEKRKEKIRIQGTVVDRGGTPFPGASIVDPSSKRGTVTDLDGHFTLDVDDRGTRTEVRISMIGMETQSVRPDGRRTLHVVLEESATMLNDVVVTGYQTISKERSAGSYSIVDGTDISDKAGLTGNIVESMEGLTTGLSINYGEGQERLTIRGITSINSTRTPLYVVDGIPIEADVFESMVNSNDIKSVTFLKDATAASIWGAQAANGVIVVTTKQGENTGKKVRISYNGSYTYRGIPDSDYMDYMDTGEFLQAARETFDPDYYTWNVVTTTANGISGVIPIVYPHEQILYGQLNGTMTEAEATQAWQRLAALNNRQQIEDLFYTPEFLTNHSLSFSGGSDIYHFYGSFAYDHQTTYTKDKDNTYKLNIRQDFTPVSWLKIDLGVNLALNDTRYSMLPSQTNLESIFPYQMFRDSDGNALSHADLLYYEPSRLTYEAQSGRSLDYVPLTDNEDGFHKSNGYDARLNLGIHIDLFKGLSYDGRFQYQRGTNKEETFYDQNSYRVREELVSYATYDEENGAPVFYLPVSGGYFTQNHTNTTNWTVRNQLMYDRTFDKIESQFTALVGFEVRSDKTNVSNAYLRGYNPQTMTYTQYDELFLSSTGVSNPIIPAVASPVTLSARTNSFSEVEKRFVSAYANAAYTYKQKYSLNASIRVDQSNLFGSDPSVQFKPIWSVGGAWSMGEENFMQAATWLDRLNLRFSYGLSGNSPDPGLGGPYDILYPVNNSSFASLGQGYVVITPANDKLIWEKTRTINAGIDFDLFGNRLSGSIDAYFKNTTDLLGDVAMHPSSGWSTALANFGSMRNRGVEITLNSLNLKIRDFTWRTNFTLTYNKNKVTELYIDDANTPSDRINANFVEGYAAGALFAYRWAGLDEMGDPQVYDENGNKVKLSSDLTNPEALRYMGSIQPLWYGGLTNQFSYKGFTFSFMFVYNLGHKMRNDVNSFWSNRLTGNIHKDFAKRWKEPGDEAYTNIPAYISNGNQATTRRETTFYRYADINVLNASYVKLRDLTLSYTLPTNIARKLLCDNIRVRFQAANLFCIAANGEGIDPEAHNLRYGYRGDHYGPSFSIGLNIDL